MSPTYLWEKGVRLEHLGLPLLKFSASSWQRQRNTVYYSLDTITLYEVRTFYASPSLLGSLVPGYAYDTTETN
jgi:hypothetical protein